MIEETKPSSALRNRFGGYCLVFGALTAVAHLGWGLLLIRGNAAAEWAVAYLLWALLPLTAAVWGLGILRGASWSRANFVYVLTGVTCIAFFAEGMYLQLRGASAFHWVRNFLLTAWYPFLGWLWWRYSNGSDAPVLWSKPVGIYLMGWAFLCGGLLLERYNSYPLGSVLALVLLVFCFLGLIAGIEMVYANRVLQSTLTIVAGFAVVLLFILNLFWLGYMWFLLRGVAQDEWALYRLVGGLAEATYLLAPLVWVVVVYWGATDSA
ncbi:MAG: hypothetical protein WHT28_02565 [Fimbriimonadales bacterium]